MPQVSFATSALRTETLEFEDVAAVVTFLKKASNFWRELTSSVPNEDVRKTVENMGERIKACWTAVQQAKDVEHAAQLIRDRQGNAQSLMVFPHCGNVAELIEHCRREYGDDAAAFFVQMILEKGVTGKHWKDSVYGKFLALLYAEEVSSRTFVESPFNKMLDECRQKVETECKGWNGKVDKSRDEIEEARKQLAASQQAFDTLKANFEAFNQTYIKIKQMEEPSGYWGNKRLIHLGLGIGALLLAVGIGIIGGSLILQAVNARSAEIKTVLTEKSKTIDDALKAWAVNAAVNGFFTLLTSAGLVWILRILVRIALTQLHLSTDAAERAVMISTYLSMVTGNNVLKEKVPIESEGLAIILASIFRHGTTGFFDEAAPQVSGAHIAAEVVGKKISGS